MEKLAIEGGMPVREKPMPARGLITEQEKAAVIKLFDEAIASGNAFGYNGEHEQQYERDFIKFMGGGFADGVNSGTNAIFCALGGLQLDAFSEVIVPPITDTGGVMPVLFVGCVPVFADSDPRSYNTNAEEIKKCITERTRAIIVAHIAGEPADMDPIMKLARKHNLYVIEDCAQSHGAIYKGRKVGSIGDIAAFSTMFGKHHCTGGQGGVVYSTNEKLFWQTKRFADRGKPFNIENQTNNVVAGLNCNLNDLSAVIGSVQIKKLPKIIENRQKVGTIVMVGLSKSKALSIGWQVPDSKSVYWYLRIKINLDTIKADKEQFCNALTAEGIGAVTPSYRHIPCEKPWFQTQAVFGNSGFPWQCSDYKGNRRPEFKIPNAIAVTDSHFNIGINESYGVQEANDIVTALQKVENAYIK
jgi:perosamine synthetase